MQKLKTSDAPIQIIEIEILIRLFTSMYVMIFTKIRSNIVQNDRF